MLEDFMDKKEFSKYKHQEMFEEYANRPLPQGPDFSLLQANPIMVKYLADKIVET